MDWFLVLTFVIGLVSSTLSGMAGGGGGFFTVPYFLFLGLPPANAIATAKLVGIGTATGSLTALKGKGLVHKKLVYKFMAITLVCSIASAWLIPRIDPAIFQKFIGVVLILLTPTLLIKKGALQPGDRPKQWLAVGFFAYTIFSFLQTLIGTGMGSILVLILMLIFGLGALEASATKRVAQSIQSVILFGALAFQGLVYWGYGLAGLVGSLIGSHLGTHIAIKKGDKFVKIMLAIVMLVSGIALLV